MTKKEKCMYRKVDQGIQYSFQTPLLPYSICHTGNHSESRQEQTAARSCYPLHPNQRTD